METKDPAGKNLYIQARTLMEQIGLNRKKACERVGLDLSLYDYYRNREKRTPKESA